MSTSRIHSVSSNEDQQASKRKRCESEDFSVTALLKKPHRLHASGADGRCTVAQLSATQWVQAMMGRGTETILDTTHRKTMKAEETPLVAWPQQAVALEELRKQLCPWFPAHSLTAELHNVLCYNSGDFFKLHRDSPKGETHLMTMSVNCTPPGTTPVCQGGDIKLASYSGATTTVHPAAEEVNGSWAGWFNTTWHEVTPVTKGTRYVATYNVSLKPEAVNEFKPPRDSEEWKTVVELARAFQGAKRFKDLFDGYISVPDPMPFLLDNEYVFADYDEKPLKELPRWKLHGRDRLIAEAVQLAFGSGDEVPVVEIGYGATLNASHDQQCDMGDFEGMDHICEVEEVFPYAFANPFNTCQHDAGNEGGGYTNFYAKAALMLEFGSEKRPTLEQLNSRIKAVEKTLPQQEGVEENSNPTVKAQ